MEDKPELVEEKTDKIMITRIIGEMKNIFNKSETTDVDLEGNSLSGNDDTNEIDKEPDQFDRENDHIEAENTNKAINLDEINTDDLKEADSLVNLPEEQPQEVESPKIEVSVNNLKTSNKKITQKSSKTTNQVLKRSVRQRKSKDCESVLQSAILRKEKSYNESAGKPQRSTRQLKLTPKIIENLGQFSNSRDKIKVKSTRSNEKYKVNNSGEGFKSVKSGKHKVGSLDKNLKKVKKAKLEFEEKKDDFPGFEKLEDENKSFRRSQRKSTSRFKDQENDFNSDLNTLEANTAEQDSNLPAEPENSSLNSDLISSKLCFCAKQSNIYLSSSNSTEVFCQAVDSFEGKQLGCNNLVNIKETPLTRPSCRIPFGALCTVHFNRMLRHNRCPSCGVFCTQGKFVECENKHHYHRNCQLTVQNANLCPHCGTSTNRNVFITMYSSKNPVFIDKQRKFYPTAKMSFPNKFSAVTRNDRDSPLLPPDISEYEIIPNGYDKKVDLETMVEVIKMEDYEQLARILGSKSFQLTTLYETHENDSLIHFCAKNGYLPALHMFYLINAEFEILDKEQNTPLMVAIVAFKNDVVKYLIKCGANIYFKGMDGMTALHLSAQYGNLTACELLLQAAINKKEYINKCDDGGWTALVWACEYSCSEIVLYLLRKGADPMVQDLKQNVALHWAACSGSQECMSFLLDFGSDINCVNVQGDTPLHIASREDKYNAVILLLLRGGDASLSNKLGETPIDCALENGDCYKAIALNLKLQAIACRLEKNRIIVTNDISNGRELNPIQCINQIDNDPKPTDFIYITDYCFTSDINVDVKLTSLHQCTCEDDCNSECICAQNSLNPYDEDGKLVDFNFYDPPLIFECNNLCPCNALTCTNRVVQKGLKCRFELYKTDSKGWGVKSLTQIPKGRFVCEYIGEIISDLEADHRSDDYLFDLDDRESDTYCIDAKKYGNIARFFNHSCDANLTPVKVFVNHQDVNFPRIALFANREIQPEEELCFDYGIKYWIIKSKTFTCECQSVKCQYSTETIQETLEAYKFQMAALETNEETVVNKNGKLNGKGENKTVKD